MVDDARFLQLPPETHLAPRAQSTVYSVSDGLLYCAVGLEDWLEVVSTSSARLESDRENFWARTYLALALRVVRRSTDTQQSVEEILKRGLERLQPCATLTVSRTLYLFGSNGTHHDRNSAFFYVGF
jgi:hypothetical protein